MIGCMGNMPVGKNLIKDRRFLKILALGTHFFVLFRKMPFFEG
jgi:hypothetical protein